MKHVLEPHNAIITSTPEVDLKITPEPKDGSVIPHLNLVSRVVFYEEKYEGNKSERVTSVTLTRQEIVDMYNEIQKIEKDRFDEKYSDLPF